MPDLKRPASAAALALFLGAISGCGGSAALAPVDSFDNESASRPAAHTVKRGETLYSIAWLYGLDYRNLAARNGVKEPFTIFPGQRLKLDAEAATTARGAPAETRAAAPSSTKGTNWTALDPEKRETPAAPESPPEPPKPAAPAKAKTPKPGAGRSKPTARKAAPEREVNGWMWPTEGRVITNFSRSGRKGVNIAGRLGQSVVAAADGRVVYAGGGLRGYGELIIVKHNKRFLSAYAHNNRILVKEGDTVKVGQRIAEMGSTGTDKVMLHFEIRRDGKPVDPVRYLPK